MRAYPGPDQVRGRRGQEFMWDKKASVRFSDFLAKFSQQGVK